MNYIIEIYKNYEDKQNHMDKGKITDKREALLNAALELFVEKGIYNAPTSQISKKAGVATGTLFLYFKNKEELIKELYLDIIKEMRDCAMDFNKSGSVSQILGEIWYKSVDWSIKNPEKFLYINQYIYSSLITSSILQDVFDIYDFLFPIFKQGVNENIIKDYPPNVIFYLYTSSILQSSKWLIKGNDNEKIKEIFFEAFWNSIKA